MTRDRSELDRREITKDFPWKRRVAKAGGREIKAGSSNIRINWDRVQDDSVGQLVNDDILANRLYQEMRAALRDPNLREKDRVKFTRMAERAVETLLANRRTWCPTCRNFLHVCSCEPWGWALDRMVSEVGVEIIHRLRQEDVDRKEAEKDREKLVRRAAYKAAKKAQRQLRKGDN
jgi:hypothetical protein